MRTINRVLLAVSVILLAVGAAACSADSPTALTTAPAGPRLESGVGFGSGNIVGGDGTKADNKAAADSGSAAVDRGATFGSEN